MKRRITITSIDSPFGRGYSPEQYASVKAMRGKAIEVEFPPPPKARPTISPFADIQVMTTADQAEQSRIGHAAECSHTVQAVVARVLGFPVGRVHYVVIHPAKT